MLNTYQLRRVGLAGITVIFVLAGCGSQSERGSEQLGIREGSMRTSTGSYSSSALDIEAVPLPAGSGTVRLIAGDVKGQGAWIVVPEAAGIVLAHWDSAEGVLSSWSLGVPESASNSPGGIAIGPTGDVWVGIGTYLVEFDPAKAQVVQTTSVDVPSNFDDAAAELYRPPELQGEHGIQGVAVTSAGNVIVGVQAANVVFDIDPSGAVTNVVLPANTDTSQIASIPGGGFAVGMENYVTHLTDTIDLVGADGTISQTVSNVDASAVVASARGLIFGTGTTATANVTTSATGAPQVSGSISEVSSSVGALPNALQLAALPGGVIAKVSGQSILVIGADGATTADYSFPNGDESCSMSSGAGSSTTTEVAPCGVAPLAIASDSDGNIWISAQPGYVSEIPPTP
jgi:hypothetical protein